MSEIDRRTFIKGAGVATGVAATGAGASSLDLAPVEEAEAIPPLVIGAGVAAGGVALGWALREFEVIGADDPPSGLTADSLENQIIQLARTRASSDRSTIVDNENILKGINHTAYVDAKIAAFEALNNGKSESEVLSDATSAIDNYESTIKSNLIKSWNETVQQFGSFIDSLNAHSELTPTDMLSQHHSGEFFAGNTTDLSNWSIVTNYVSESLPDGTSQGVHAIKGDTTAGSTMHDYLMATEGGGPWSYGVSTRDGSEEIAFIDLFDGGEHSWRDIWEAMNTEFTDVRDGISLWIDSVYGQVQSGEVSVSDLITPKERAAMMTDDGKYPQAVADLLALNVPVDFEREATVSLDWHDDDVTLSGTLAITSPPDNLTPGTYDPQADSLGSVYLTYDVGAAEGVWTAYDDSKGVDGGTVEFESEPYEEVTYDIVTNYDETASVTSGDFTEGTDGSSNKVWTVDVSDQLENSIAEISEVTYYTDTDETRYETIQMEGTFTIEEFTNTETGEQADSASFTSSEPQTDNNYVTQEEWNQLQQQNEELIEEYEDSQSGGGGGLFPDAPDIPGWGIVVAVGGIALVLLGQSDDNGY